MSSLLKRLFGPDAEQNLDADHPDAVAIVPQSPSFHAVDALDDEQLDRAVLVHIDEALEELGACRYCYDTTEVAGQTALVYGD